MIIIVLRRRHALRPIEYMELITENGLEGLSEMIRLMVNQAMKFKRENFLNAQAYERSEDRTGYANGYKPKTVNTRVGGKSLFRSHRCERIISIRMPLRKGCVANEP